MKENYKKRMQHNRGFDNAGFGFGMRRARDNAFGNVGVDENVEFGRHDGFGGNAVGGFGRGFGGGFGGGVGAGFDGGFGGLVDGIGGDDAPPINDGNHRIPENYKTFKWRGRVMSSDEVREEFEPEYTDEKRNEWLQWIEERSKRYSIEPVIINRFPVIYFDSDDLNWTSTDYYIYSTEYGTYEVPEKFVESCVAKSVDVIMRARGQRFPLVIIDPLCSDWYKIIVPTDIPKKSSDPPDFGSPVDRSKKDDFNLMELFVNQNTDYKNFCEDLYEKYDDIVYNDFSGFNYLRWQWRGNAPSEKTVWFDEFTGEFCLKLMEGRKTFGKNLTIRPFKHDIYSII